MTAFAELDAQNQASADLTPRSATGARLASSVPKTARPQDGALHSFGGTFQATVANVTQFLPAEILL
jgi:hypothetical protein